MKRGMPQPLLIGLIVLGFVLAGVGGYFILIAPQHSKAASLDKQIADTSDAIDSARALTLQAAEVLGVADRMGSLEAGKLGNVIVTDGDPMEITTHLHALFMAGKPCPLESKHTRLYQTYLQRLPASGSPGNGAKAKRTAAR